MSRPLRTRLVPAALVVAVAFVAAFVVAVVSAGVPAVAAGVPAVAVPAVAVPAAPAYAEAVSDQWHLGALKVPTAWRHANGSGVTVAVLDSGVDAAHPDLAGQVLPGKDFVDGSTDGRRDFVGHGTTVAGLIAGRNDGNGAIGVAPKAKILPVRVLDAQNRYDDASVVAAGVRWAVDNGAKVVNVSLGGGARSDVLADALVYAAEHDVVIIACTGNISPETPPNEVWYPAREPGVVAVTGLTTTGGGGRGAPAGPGSGAGTGAGAGGASAEMLWSGSLTGRETVLAAPAVDLLGAKPGGYWRVQGTSFAAPLVTAVAALVRSRYPTLNAANVVNRLIRTAQDLGPPGRDDQYGFGEVDPVAALTGQVPEVTANPLRPEPAAVADPGHAHTNVPPHRAVPAPPAATAAPGAGPSRLALTVGIGAVAFLLLLVAGLAALKGLPRARARP